MTCNEDFDYDEVAVVGDGNFFLALWFGRKSPFILVVGGAFLVYSFYSKKMEPTKLNRFKPELKLRGPKKSKSKKGKKK